MTQPAPRSSEPAPPSPFDTPSPHYRPHSQIEARGGADGWPQGRRECDSGHAGATCQSPSSMTSMRNNGAEIAVAVATSYVYATSHWRVVELHACATELASLHDGCSSKQARGASCDAAPLVSCLRRCRTGELHAPSPTSTPASSSVTMSVHSPK